MRQQSRPSVIGFPVTHCCREGRLQDAGGASPRGTLPAQLSSSALSLGPLIHPVCPPCSCGIECTTSAFFFGSGKSHVLPVQFSSLNNLVLVWAGMALCSHSGGLAEGSG